MTKDLCHPGVEKKQQTGKEKANFDSSTEPTSVNIT